MSEFKIGDVVIVTDFTDEYKATITELPGYSETYPNCYRVHTEYGMVGLVFPSEMVLVERPSE